MQPHLVTSPRLLSCIVSSLNSIVRRCFYILTGGGVIVNPIGLDNNIALLKLFIEALTPPRHVRYALILGRTEPAPSNSDRHREQDVNYADW